ncbi:phage major capsid protein [Leuconostoc falkenbergense]|uniref:phage major capsid protein n=1 Tax=Leuconostoc falkenbergense TaxID=2766470 RepID=UPI0021AA3A44|nr:phage major capsid protein [Leuconostoc falkenbergense]MCT4420306.1 phage major capsid protein [Leuconostoc falkenbergense]
MAKTLIEMQAAAREYGQIAAQRQEEYLNVLNKIESTTDEIKAAETARDTMKQKYDALNKEVKAKEASLRERNISETENKPSKREKAVDGFADMVRGVVSNNRIAKLDDFKNAVLAPTTAPVAPSGGDTNGAWALPTNVSTDFISAPLAPNPLVDAAAHSAIVNLEIPRIDITFGTAFNGIADGDTAKEITLKGSDVKFGRVKSKVFVGLSETVLAGTNLALTQFVYSRLQDGLLKLEANRAFATTPATGEEHMSLYNSVNAIKKITGDDQYSAIVAAIADFEDEYADNLSIFMSRKDWFAIQTKLANGNNSFYSQTPEQVFGIPVHLTAKAVKPVIGDFSQYHVNYDPTTAQFEQDKDIKTGIVSFVATTWVDAQVKLAAAFRIADAKGSLPSLG